MPKDYPRTSSPSLLPPPPSSSDVPGSVAQRVPVGSLARVLRTSSSSAAVTNASIGGIHPVDEGSHARASKINEDIRTLCGRANAQDDEHEW